MKTSTYNTGTKSLLFAVVPKDAYDFMIIHEGTRLSYLVDGHFKRIDLPKEYYIIISTLSNITEEQCEELGFDKLAFETAETNKDIIEFWIYKSGLELGENEDVLIFELN